MSEPITQIRTPVRLSYTVTAPTLLQGFLENLMQGKIMGHRGPDGKVYVPPRLVSPKTAEPMGEDWIELAHVGTVTTFCVINIPFEGQVLKPPYVGAAVLLDGADLPLFHLVGGVDPAEVRMGMRVKARWRDEPIPSIATIEYFEPTGEPDTPFERYAEHL